VVPAVHAAGGRHRTVELHLHTEGINEGNN
jgi:hypothetical protein